MSMNATLKNDRPGKIFRAAPDTPAARLDALSATEFRLSVPEAIGSYDLDELLGAVHEAIDGALMQFPHLQQIELIASEKSALAQRLMREGFAVQTAERVVLPVEMLNQQPRYWLRGHSSSGYPLAYTLTNGKRHPVRPPKPEGLVYSRFISWLDCTFSLRTLEWERDLGAFHRWMNEPRVAQFWQENGDLDKHRKYLQDIAADPHIIPFIACFGDKPFAYFEAYWAREDRIAPFYDAEDYDRGWHALVGEEEFLGRQYVAAWIPSFMHYLFLDDARTHRVVGEPRHDNQKIIANLERNGFSKIKHFDFPHKRALLVMLLRERFFGDRLLAPQWDGTAGTNRQPARSEA